MTLYQIIKSLQNASGKLEKQAILEANKEDGLLKAYLKAVYDPSISYYQTRVCRYGSNLGYSFNEGTLSAIQATLAQRELTGDAAKKWLDNLMKASNSEAQELIELLIKRSIGASVGDTMILKTFPNLWFSVPYQRCSLLDAKAKERFSREEVFISQKKLDGSFCYLVKEAGKAPQAITRAGSTYPLEFAQNLAARLPDGFVVIGELLVVEDCGEGQYITLDRQTGNGILNSVLKGGDIDRTLSFDLVAWDCITPGEFKAGHSKTPYKQRMANLEWFWENIVETKFVKSLEEAFAINSQYTSQGLEGSVIKTLDFEWKNGTSKNCVKLKVEFEAEYVVTAINEGSGKAKGMMGSLSIESSDGKIKCEVGTGFSDTDRIDWWLNSVERVESIVTVKGNDIISSKSNNTHSLFLPVYIEQRLDKTVADNYSRCLEQLNATKGIT